MRNAVAHGYFKVDFEILWMTIQADLPGLHALIQQAQWGLLRDGGIERADPANA